jgi:hypothetical protein
MTYCVKTRETGKKHWKFVTSKGGVNRLRIHAAQFNDKSKADALAVDINDNNRGEWEARVDIFSA